jgi:hypothetical protein
MEFIVLLTVAVIFAAGIFTIVPAPAVSRFGDERAGDFRNLRAVLLHAANAAGKYAAGLRIARRTEAVRKELYTALSILRNHASADLDGGTPGRPGAQVTADSLLEQFAQMEGVLREAFAGALRLFRTGRRSEAIEYFSKAAIDPLARDFIMLVLDLDAVAPHKLRKTVLAFQNTLRETRTTELMRKNEVMSDFVYLPVVTGVLIVFVNFIYVAYFAEQRELLTELFF